MTTRAPRRDDKSFENLVAPHHGAAQSQSAHKREREQGREQARTTRNIASDKVISQRTIKYTSIYQSLTKPKHSISRKERLENILFSIQQNGEELGGSL